MNLTTSYLSDRNHQTILDLPSQQLSQPQHHISQKIKQFCLHPPPSASPPPTDLFSPSDKFLACGGVNGVTTWSDFKPKPKPPPPAPMIDDESSSSDDSDLEIEHYRAVAPTPTPTPNQLLLLLLRQRARRRKESRRRSHNLKRCHRSRSSCRASPCPRSIRRSPPRRRRRGRKGRRRRRKTRGGDSGFARSARAETETWSF